MGDTTCEHDWHWYISSNAAANEEGWKCANCDFRPGEPPGYSPQLDTEHIEKKVFGLLHDLHDMGFIYVSNGSAGEGIVESIAASCRADSCYDQQTIIARILGGGEASDSHATYWRVQGEAIRAGNDPRKRCHCGKLANSYRAGKATCSAHSGNLFDEDDGP